MMWLPLLYSRNNKRVITAILGIAGFIIGGFCWMAGAQPAVLPRQAPAAVNQESRSVWDGVYTEDQAKRGAAAATRECGTCHGATMAKGDEAPPLAGEAFLAEWDGQTLDGLFERMSRTMPQTAPGKLSAQEYVDILAQILNLNKFPAGKTELESGLEGLKQIRIEATKPKTGQDSSPNPKIRDTE
jgi:S-disulfanyl-L-cysteine oxidoreductase SoxD